MVDSERETGRIAHDIAATGTVPRWPSSFFRGAASQDSHSKHAIRAGSAQTYLITRLRTMPIITKLGSVCPTTPIQMLRNRFAG